MEYSNYFASRGNILTKYAIKVLIAISILQMS